MIASTFLGFPILLLPPDLDREATSRSHLIGMDAFQGDSDGTQRTTYGAPPGTEEEISFLCKTRGELQEVQDFLASVAGRHISFWLPTWNDDVTVLSPGGGARIIRDIDFTNRFLPIQAFSYLHVASRSDYTQWCVLDVSNSVNNGNGTETLYGGYSVGGTFDTATSATHNFSFLRFVRLNVDEVSVEYIDGTMSMVRLPILNVPGSYPPFNPPPGYTPIVLSNVISPFDATMKIASLRGTPAGDWFTSTVADPGALTTCGGIPGPRVPCPLSLTLPYPLAPVTWRTEPVAPADLFGPMRVTALAGNGGATYDRYSKLHLSYTIRQMRMVLGVPTAQLTIGSNWRPTSWSGGGITASVSPVTLLLVAGDWLEIDLNGMVGLWSGYTDGGGRPGMTYGSPYTAYLYVYGKVLPQFP